MSDEELGVDGEELLTALAQGEDEEDEEPRKSRPVATLDQLKKKHRVTKTIYITVNDDDGDPVEASMTFRGIPAYEYDKLASRFPPKPKDKKQGFGYDPDLFGPALIAATCIEPDLSEEDVTEIWASDDWNRGERMQLFMAAIEVCTTGQRVPFTKRGSS